MDSTRILITETAPLPAWAAVFPRIVAPDAVATALPVDALVAVDLGADADDRAWAQFEWLAAVREGVVAIVADGRLRARCLGAGALAVCEIGDMQAMAAELDHAEQLLARLHGLEAAQRALKDGIERWQAAVDTLPCPIFFKDAEGVYRGCNAAFGAFIGLPTSRIVGASVFDVAPPDLARVYEAADRALFDAGGHQIYEARVRYADGGLRDVTFYKARFDDAGGKPMGLSGAMLDITDRKTLEAELRALAETDPLTGLLNRRSFFERASERYIGALASPRPLALLAMDIDRFKSINDAHGHAVGDEVLKWVIARIAARLRGQDLFGRIGGDELCVLIDDCSEDGALAVAQRLCAHIAAEPCPTAAGPLRVTLSIGAADIVATPERTLQAALEQADAALYAAKRGGRNRARTSIAGDSP